MHEFAIDSDQLTTILDGAKTVELRIGTPDTIALRKNHIIRFINDESSMQAEVEITQLLYFETFEEAIASLPFEQFLPTVHSGAEALHYYHQHYTRHDIEEYGVVAARFKLLS